MRCPAATILILLALMTVAEASTRKAVRHIVNPPCFNGWVDRVALLCPGQEFWRDEKPRVSKHRRKAR